MSMTVKKGDNILVIAGKDKGKTGKVLEVFPESNRVLVDGINVVTKHKKARSQQDKSGIFKQNAPIDASNVMVVCPSCGKATRVGHKIIDGKKVRVCKCGVSLDKAYVKATKKDVKKAAKNEEKPVKEAKTAPKTEKVAEKPAAKATTTKVAKAETAPKKAAPAKSGTKTTTTQKSTKQTSKKEA